VKLKKHFVTGLATLIIIIICGIIYYNFSISDNQPTIEVFTGTPSDSLIEEVVHILIVYVTGEVMYPGVYELEENSRLQDAILIAGGATEYADLSIINLARFISDGEHIIVPAFGDPPPPALGQSPGRININTATQSELTTLPNIGPATAANIIAHREQHGRFEEIEQIKYVTRIGERTFESIEDLITVR